MVSAYQVSTQQCPHAQSRNQRLVLEDLHWPSWSLDFSTTQYISNTFNAKFEQNRIIQHQFPISKIILLLVKLTIMLQSAVGLLINTNDSTVDWPSAEKFGTKSLISAQFIGL